MRLPNISASVVRRSDVEAITAEWQDSLFQQSLVRRASKPHWTKEIAVTAVARSVFCDVCKIKGCTCEYPRCVCGFTTHTPTAATPHEVDILDFALAVIGCYVCGTNPDDTPIICCHE